MSFLASPAVLTIQKILLTLLIDSFSDFFKKRDEAEYELYDQDKVMDWRYKKIRDGWQKPLEKKRQRRERLALIKAQEVFKKNFYIQMLKMY